MVNTVNKGVVSDTLTSATSGTTYPFRKEGRHREALLQVHTYTADLSGTYHLEVAQPGSTNFTQLCNTDGSVIEWTDQGVVFTFNPAGSCDVRITVSAYTSGTLVATIRAE